MKIYRKLDKERYQMDFVVCAPGFYDQEVQNQGGKVYPIPLRTEHPFRSFSAIRRIVRENRYEYVLKLCDTPIALTDLLAAKFGGARRISVRSCNASTGSGRGKEALFSLLRPLFNRLADCKIAPSELAARYTFGNACVNKGKVKLLHNGLDLSTFHYDEEGRKKLREEFGIGEKTLVLGHVGRFSRQKNHSFLLDIFQEVHNRVPDSMLMLVGQGELKEEIEDKLARLGLADRVLFTGVRADIPQLLSAMDLFVFPSFYEGMPNTVIEAQAAGLPCVISDTITREVNISGKIDYLPLTENASVWADCVCAKADQDVLSREDPRSIEETRSFFYENGYNIEGVVKEFCRLIFGE